MCYLQSTKMNFWFTKKEKSVKKQEDYRVIAAQSKPNKSLIQINFQSWAILFELQITKVNLGSQKERGVRNKFCKFRKMSNHHNPSTTVQSFVQNMSKQACITVKKGQTQKAKYCQNRLLPITVQKLLQGCPHNWYTYLLYQASKNAAKNLHKLSQNKNCIIKELKHHISSVQTH